MFTRYCFDSVSNTIVNTNAASVNTHVNILTVRVGVCVRVWVCKCECQWGYRIWLLAFGFWGILASGASAVFGIFMNGKRSQPQQQQQQVEQQQH